MKTIENITSWALDGWGHIQPVEDGECILNNPAEVAKFVAETRPIVEKYGLVMKDCDCEVGEIDIQNDTTISAEKLDEFFADFQRLIDIIRANNLKLVAYSDRLIPSGTNEDDKGPAIVLSIDENGKLNREFIGV